MAFVYRSQKKSIFEEQIFNNQNQLHPTISAQAQNENKLQDKSIDMMKIAKGLPSSNEKLKNNADDILQQKVLPQFSVKPIHKIQSSGTLKQILYQNRTQSKEQKQNYKSINTVFQVAKSKKIHKNSLIFSSANKAMKTSEYQEKPQKCQLKIQKAKQCIQHIRSEQNIVNKNLLKTLSMLRPKQNITQSFKQINVINEKHCKTAFDPHNSKRFNFQSMKKLSPIKFQVQQQNLLQNAISLFLNNKTLPKIEGQSQTKQNRNEIKRLMRFQQKQKPNEDQEEQQFDQGATPGPGAYSIQNWNKKKQFRSKKQKFGKIFYSSLQRFESPPKLKEVTSVKEQKVDQILQSPTKNTFTSFLSKSPRFDEKKPIQIPPLGYYNTRQTLEYDLIKNILKGSNSDTFINTELRHSIITKKKEVLPGPGSYHVDSFVNKLVQEHGTLTSNYKSKLTRNLHQESKDKAKKKDNSDSIVQREEDEKFNPIHIQDASTLPADYQIDVPPFLSSSQRFPSLKPICKESFIKKKPQIPFKKQVKKQAFNSSQKRNLQSTVGNGVGVGLYNIAAKQIWDKKSHNILFN